jgi:hypothetical protein
MESLGKKIRKCPISVHPLTGKRIYLLQIRGMENTKRKVHSIFSFIFLVSVHTEIP